MSLNKENELEASKTNSDMNKDIKIIAIPVSSGQLSAHFGHCDEFHFYKVDVQSKEIKDVDIVKAPPHQPGFLPGWLASNNANILVAGGIGGRAIDLLQQQNVKVIIGVNETNPKGIVDQYLSGALKSGDNLCDH
jgi:predicted Fe-Mo cluster-binding NifX family protein